MATMSLVPWWWMKAPALRNSSALKMAWVTKWNTPANRLPAARPMSMKPSWLMELKASTRFMSEAAVVMVEDITGVEPPANSR